VAVREGWLPAAEFRMPNVETGRTAFESAVHISVAADSNTDPREFWNGGEGGITRPASAARMLPAFERCLHALLWRQGQSNEFESPVHEDAECCETAEYN
jgi:hypothetical protein